MIAQELEVSLHMAFVEARQQRHEFITVEHLLLSLLDNPSAAEVLRACSANIDDLRASLTNFIKDNTPQVAGTDDVDTQPTLGFQRVIQRAIMHVQSTGSLTHCKGCPAWRAASCTCWTLVAATSREKTPQMPFPSRWIFSMIWVAVSRSLLKNSWITTTTNSMGV